jgi:hypothetical protein
MSALFRPIVNEYGVPSSPESALLIIYWRPVIAAVADGRVKVTDAALQSTATT